MTLNNVLFFWIDLWVFSQYRVTFLPCKFQLHCLEKNGRQITKMVSFCAYHRYRTLMSEISLLLSFFFLNHLCLELSIWITLLSYLESNYSCALYSFNLLSLWYHLHCRAPNPDTVLIIQSPLGVFSAKSLLQNKKKAGSRLISSNRKKIKEIPREESTELEPFSAARCRIFKRLNNHKKVLCMRFFDLHAWYICPRIKFSERFCWLIEI